MKLTTKRFLITHPETLSFTYEVQVNTSGLFYTYLPQGAIQQLENYGITMPVGATGKKGYFYGKSIEDLESAIRNFANEALSRELIRTFDVIEYQLLIGASYCKNRIDPQDPTLYPNGSFLKQPHSWIYGPASSEACFFSVYARPRTYKQYRYASGKETSESYPIDPSNYPADSAVTFLNGIVTKPDRCSEIKTIPCTEANANFFRSAHMVIWNINEQLGQFIKDGTLETALDDTALSLKSCVIYGDN
jgi:hypothetical protein